MSETPPTGAAVAEVMGELAALENPQMRAANERRGDDHGVNLVPSTSANDSKC